jgi:hypothetical protein
MEEWRKWRSGEAERRKQGRYRENEMELDEQPQFLIYLLTYVDLYLPRYLLVQCRRNYGSVPVTLRSGYRDKARIFYKYLYL